MAASHLVKGSRALLQVSIPQGSLDPNPLSPNRTALVSPPRPALGFHGALPRALPLSPTKSTALSPVCNAVTLEALGTSDEAKAAPLSSPRLLQALVISAHSDESLRLADALLVDAVTASSAHILGAAVALLNSPAVDATLIQEADAIAEEEQSSQGVAHSTAESATETLAAVAAVSGDVAPDAGAPSKGSGQGEGSEDLPWWLAGDGGNAASATGEDATHASWWAQQVEVARAQERAEEDHVLQKSLQQNKGPDAPYALDGADSLLGAATASSGQKVGERAWWSQLTKIPVEDWLPLAHGAAPQEHGEPAATVIEKPPLETETEISLEARDSEAQDIAQGTEIEREVLGVSTKSVAVETEQQPLTADEAGTLTTALPDSTDTTGTDAEIHVTGAQPAVVPTEHKVQETAQDPPIVDVTVIEQSTVQEGETEAVLDTQDQVGEASQVEEDPSHVGATALQAPVTSTDSPVKTDALLAILTDREQALTPSVVSTIESLNEILSGATLAPPQPAEAPVETINTNSPSEIMPTDSSAIEPAVAADPASQVLNSKQALEEAKQRLETIKAWRQNRGVLLPRAASSPLLPSMTSEPFLPLSSSSVTRKSSVVASFATPGHVPHSTVWKTLRQMEWASEDTSDQFGRTSVAVHLAERHEDDLGGAH